MTKHRESRRDDLLAYVIDYREETGCSPTIREMEVALELASPATVHLHLLALEKEGRMRRCGHERAHWLPVLP